MNAQLVAVILTKNEAQHIQECIAGLRGWTNAVVVWDSGSTDATCALARAAGALVVQRPFDTYAAQRQAALDSVNAEWVLFVDADERATPELAQEVRAVLASASPCAGYWIPRRNFIAGQETRWGGYSPDYQLRLLQRRLARYAPRAVHEVVEVEGETGHLSAPLIHYNYRDWAHFHQKQRGYARFEARILAERGIRPRPHNFLLQPLREFRRRYITLQGRRDGRHGLRLALWLAWYYGFMPYWYLLRR
ncbi:MAG TPA: glycosyltransferase family 2 protein [Caldilineaceae bacterium]|nr:glycosyltransferase family 2 protein [Caldilineaceae bacterium]